MPENTALGRDGEIGDMFSPSAELPSTAKTLKAMEGMHLDALRKGKRATRGGDPAPAGPQPEPRARTQRERTDAEPSVSSAQAASATTAASTTATSDSPGGVSAQAGGGVGRVSTTVPEDVWHAAGRYCREHNVTRLTMIMRALAATAAEHQELVALERSRHGSASAEDAEMMAFWGVQELPATRGSAVAKKQLPFYASPAMVSRLDDLVSGSGAANRAELLGAVLRRYLQVT